MTDAERRSVPLVMNVRETADYLGRSRDWVTERINDGRLPARKDGRRYYVSRPELDRWLLNSGDQGGEAKPVVLGVPSPRGKIRNRNG